MAESVEIEDTMFIVTRTEVLHGSLHAVGQKHPTDEVFEQRDDQMVMIPMDGFIMVGDDECGYTKVDQKQVVVLARTLAIELMRKLPDVIAHVAFHECCIDNGIDPKSFQ